MTPTNTVSYAAMIDRVMRDFGVDDMSIVRDANVWMGDGLEEMSI